MVETRQRKREDDLQGLMRRVALGGGHAGVVDVGFQVVRDTRFSKKFVLPCSEIVSIYDNGRRASGLFLEQNIRTTHTLENLGSHQNDTIESLLEPSHRIILLHSVSEPNSCLLLLPPCNPCPRSSHDNIEVHAENTNSRIISSTQIDMLLDSKAKVPCLREIPATKLIFFDFKTTLQNLLGFGPSNRYVYSNFLVTTDTESTNCQIGDIIHLVVVEGYEKAVSDEFDILAHQCCVHPNEPTRQRVCEVTY
jgi:hypothetical protein